MAEEDEVDIEGDFDFKINSDEETSLIYDLNEPPSKTANLQPEFSQHPWMLEQGWSLDQVTDEKSKAVIEKMLLEEQHYNSYKMRRKPSKLEVAQTKSKSKPSSAKKFWSEEEKHQFLKGFLKWGRRWAKIAELIPGRTVQQVKNYGQQYLKTVDKKKTSEVSPMKDLASSTLPQSLESSIALVTTAQPTVSVRPGRRRPKKLVVSEAEVVRIKVEETGNEEEDIDIEDSGEEVVSDADDNHIYRSLIEAAGIKATAPKAPETQVSNEAMVAAVMDPVESVQESVDQEVRPEKSVRPEMSTQSVSENNDCPEAEGHGGFDGDGEQENLCQNMDEEVEEEEEEEEEEEVSSADEFPELENESWVMTSNGEMKVLPNPIAERILPRSEISEEEKEIHSEFFDGRSSSKNAERYLKIRNHILDHWIKSKPGYVNKTVVRVGLKNCGDVNCIGRIHAYLEQIGAINFGCEQCQYNRPVKISKPRRKVHTSAVPVIRENDATPRKRRVRAVDGTWIDEKDLEGQTIEHKELKNGIPKRVKLRHKDPFKLLACHSFSEEHPKPFDVVIEASVLVVLDVHAHQCKTEVIGMLGGKYHEDGRKLLITMAVPCDSLSTHLQCEMDPVSQSQSCMHIMAKGHTVVGWYHSHPTFRPDPSIRDMETQAKYQAWFAQGGCPFLGVIISPYNTSISSLSLHSQVRCLAASKVSLGQGGGGGDTDTDTGDPFKFDFEVGNEYWNSETLLEEVKDVVLKYVSYSKRVNLLNRYHSNSNVTCLEKLLASIQRVVPLVDDERDTFMAQLSEVIEEHYKAANMDISVMDNFSYMPDDLTEEPAKYDVKYEAKYETPSYEEERHSQDVSHQMTVLKDDMDSEGASVLSSDDTTCISDGLSLGQCEEIFESKYHDDDTLNC